MYTHTRNLLFLLLYTCALHSAHTPEQQHPHQLLDISHAQEQPNQPLNRPGRPIRQTPQAFTFSERHEQYSLGCSKRRFAAKPDNIRTITYAQRELKQQFEYERDQKQQADQQAHQQAHQRARQQEQLNLQIQARQQEHLEQQEQEFCKPAQAAELSQPDPTSVIAILERFRARAEQRPRKVSLYNIESKTDNDEDESLAPNEKYNPRKQQQQPAVDLAPAPIIIPSRNRRIIEVQPADQHQLQTNGESALGNIKIAFASPASHQQAQTTTSCVPDSCCLHQ